MAVLTMDLYSYELGMNNQVSMILPERRGVPVADREGKPYPVLYLLHGHSQDHTSWLRLTRIEYYLKDTDVVVVMPNGNRGCFVDGLHTHKYGRYLTEELPKTLKNWFNISTRREDTFISGFSMGGYGALRAAYSHPEKYAAVAALSPGIDMHNLAAIMPPDAAERGIAFPPEPEINRNFTEIFGDDEVYFGSENDLKHLAKKLQIAGEKELRTLCLCGDRDPLIEMNDDFAQFMSSECPDVPFEYIVNDGIHNFDYWDREVITALRFFKLI